MKGRFFTEKEWKKRKRQHETAVNDAYERGYKENSAYLHEQLDILAAACWLALQRDKEVLSMESCPVVVVGKGSAGKIEFRIKQVSSETIHVELYHKELLPE